MPSKTPDQLIDTMRTFFVPNYAPTTALGNLKSLFLGMPGLHSYYPLHVTGTFTGTDEFVDQSGSGFHLDTYGTPTAQIDMEGITAYATFDGSNSYLAYASDNAHFDILGNEAHISSALNGLTVGGWFRPHLLNATARGLATKFYTTGNMRAYYLAVNTANTFGFGVSNSGSAVGASVSSTATVAINNWYFVVGRYDPGTNVSIFVNGTLDTDATAVAAPLWNSSEPFTIGRYNRAGIFDGDAAHVFLCDAHVPINYIKTVYHHTRALFGV